MFGTILGSFSKALADRSLTGKSFWGRSRCPHCQHLLGILDLFPVLSFIFLKGKCRFCHKKISTEYLLVEVVMGILVVLIFYQTFSNLQFSLIFDFLFKSFFVTILLSVFLTDLKKMLIPDRIIIPSIIIATITLLISNILKSIYLYFFLSRDVLGKLLLPPYSDYWQRHAFLNFEPFFIGLATGFVIALFFHTLIIITKGRGMGEGDVKLGLFLGICLGFPNGFLGLVLGFILGAIFSLAAIILGKKGLKSQIPFGPFLSLGGFIALLWGSQIVSLYLRLGY